jgi:hypothetical protein
MKKPTMNVVIRLQIAVAAMVVSSVAVADAKICTIKHTKIYKSVPDEKSSFA